MVDSANKQKSKHMRTTVIAIAGIAGIIGCDIQAEEGTANRVAEMEEEAIVDEDEEVSGGLEENLDLRGYAAQAHADAEPGSAPQSNSDNLQSDVQPSAGGLSPTCQGIGQESFRSSSCNWERATAISGTDAQVSCDSDEFVMSGGCYATSSSHKLVSHYAAEGVLNVVDDEEHVSVGIAYNCEWDTAATMSNTHSVIALCCPTQQFASCE